jgi:hypothetical protein
MEAINGLLRAGFQWQQMAATNKKAGTRPALSNLKSPSEAKISTSRRPGHPNGS